MAFFTNLFAQRAKYIDQTPPEDRVSAKDLLEFMKAQQAQNVQMIAAILNASNAQAETLKTYVDLFKPRDVRSTTLDEREQAKSNSTEIRKSEWEGIESMNDFNIMTAGSQVGIPPEPTEF
jgi:hypothetical protein